MNWSQISRYGFFHFPWKLHNCSIKNLLVDTKWSCYLVPDTTSKWYHSQIFCKNRQEIFSNSCKSFNNLLLSNLRCCNQTVTTSSACFIFHRNLSSTSPETTGKPYHGKETGNVLKVPENNEEKKFEETQVKEASTGQEISEAAPAETAKKLSIYQRFKKTYKEHGKVLIVVHLLTSAVWFGSFYGVARCGVDVVSFMEKMNLSESIISRFRLGGLGDVAVAYLMYKLATPARYTVTIGGTNLAIRYLRKEGKIPHIAHEDTFRSFYKEGKEDFKRRSVVHIRKLKRKQKIKSRTGHKH